MAPVFPSSETDNSNSSSCVGSGKALRFSAISHERHSLSSNCCSYLMFTPSIFVLLSIPSPGMQTPKYQSTTVPKYRKSCVCRTNPPLMHHAFVHFFFISLTFFLFGINVYIYHRYRDVGVNFR